MQSLTRSLTDISTTTTTTTTPPPPPTTTVTAAATAAATTTTTTTTTTQITITIVVAAATAVAVAVAVRIPLRSTFSEDERVSESVAFQQRGHGGPRPRPPGSRGPPISTVIHKMPFGPDRMLWAAKRAIRALASYNQENIHVQDTQGGLYVTWTAASREGRQGRH